MSITFQQNDTAQACALNNYCSTVGGTIEEGRQAESGASGGVTGADVSVAASQTDDTEFSFECIFPNGTTDGAGDWTVDVNFTAGHMDATWESCFICRVNSSCVNQEEIGSATGLGKTTTGGQQNVVISGSAVTLANGDKVIVVLGFSNSGSHSAKTVTILPDATIIADAWVLPAGTRKTGRLSLLGAGHGT